MINKRERELLSRLYLMLDKVQGHAVPYNPADLARWVSNGKRTKQVGGWLTTALALTLQGDFETAGDYLDYAERDWEAANA